MVTIKSYEIARLFGLEYEGIGGEYLDYAYLFSFNGKEIVVREGFGGDEAVDEDEAKEEAAKRVLFGIGKRIALYI
jgi:hypothetical protein